MSDCREEAADEVGAAVAAPPDAKILQITARATDSIFGPVPVKEMKEDAAPSTLFRPVLRFAPYVGVAVCLFGVVWAGGSHFSGGRSLLHVLKAQFAQTAAPQDSAKRAEMVPTVQEMADEIRALKANVDAIRAAPAQGPKNTVSREELKTRLDAIRTDNAATIAELAAKVDQMERKSADRRDRIERQITAPRPVASVAASAASEPPPRKRAQGHDAFNPSQNPNAPGAPRPLGAL
jgi:outer membrane murein-binding lipoprotein Lpp